ncbi:MAG TPA: hypothetical protein VKW04_05075 [Planctomycetota bacterium]|nr:hypothetical protein [Planctomycetota bacterium]
MNQIGRFFGSRDDVPDWAKFFSPGDYRRFVEELTRDLGRRSLPFELGDGTVTVTPPDGEASDFGLLNLAQTCHATPGSDWAATIREHLDNAFRSSQDAQEIDERAGALDNVRQYLKVRLYHTDYLSQMGSAGLIHRQPAEGLVETLVYDLPGSVRTVPPDHVRSWGVTEEELFRLGLANIRSERPAPVLQTFDVGKGAVIQALVGDSFFTASHVLFLEEHLQGPAEFGALVAVPHRHAALFYPITNMGLLSAVNSMIPIAFGMYQEGPGSLSEGIYWWRAGRLRLLPTKVTAQSITFSPPDEFVEDVLDRVPDLPPED